MDYQGFMKQASDIVADRAPQYGDTKVFLDRQCQLFEGTTGIRLTSREAAMFMHVLKLNRIFEDPNNADHYVDGVNYLAFAAMAADQAKADAVANQPPPPPPTLAKTFPTIPTLNLATRLGAAAVEQATADVKD